MVMLLPTLVGSKQMLSSSTDSNVDKMYTIDKSTSDDDVEAFQYVDPSWFVSPVERISTSGGTAPFFKLTLTEKGMEEMERRNGTKIDQDYWIGKDLSHAEDEKDFYEEILRVRCKNKGNAEVDGINTTDTTSGVGLLKAFMFDYLGILKAEVSDHKESHCSLLVMANLRSNCNTFRMLDLKIGVRTACGGWKGKTHLRAMKHYFMDGLSNSFVEGYRLVGFDGVPKVIDSMDPLLDILVVEDIKSGAFSKNTARQSVFQQMLAQQSLELLCEKELETAGRPRVSVISPKTAYSAFVGQKDQAKAVWNEQIKTGKMKEYVKTQFGAKIDKSNREQAEGIMFKRMCGTNVFRFFYDFRSNSRRDTKMNLYSPTEVTEIISHQLMTQLIALSTACHKVEIPQKWIGSSVAVSADADYFPKRSSEDAEAEIRSKVICKLFDWGRSELLTDSKYETLSSHERHDRERHWNLYKKGIDRLSYNATRFYYHHFTTTTKWTDVTLEVMDFDSLSSDSYIGKVVIPLPDVSNIEAIETLRDLKTYKIKSVLASSFGSTLTCSIRWLKYPSASRFVGVWRVAIKQANDLPPMDAMRFVISSDPYVVVTANSSTGQQFHQQTCIKARNLDPVWNETIDIPVCRTSNESSMQSAFEASGIVAMEDQVMPDLFKWDRNNPDHDNVKWWRKAMQGKDLSRYGESRKKWKTSSSFPLFQTQNMHSFSTEGLKQNAVFYRGKTKVQNDPARKERWENPSKQQGKLNIFKKY